MRNHGGHGNARRLLWLALLATSGCARAHAAAIPSPPLEMPAPPPRDIEPPPPDVASPPEPAPATPEPARPAPPRPRPPAPREQPKTEPPADAKPDEPAKTTSPPTTLQTAPTAADAELERAIRVTLTRASADLRRINTRGLSAEARDQYDTASRFARQADDAIRAKNLVFARTLAEKAAALAAQLAGR
jgi:outer membrane biosynthesis protein TonB